MEPPNIWATANMAKRVLQWGRQRRVNMQSPKDQFHCSQCGMVKTEESAHYLIDQLFQSHAELCATLRSAGRQILRLEKEDEGPISLEKIRKVLKHADHIREMLGGPDHLPAAAIAPKSYGVEGPSVTSVSNHTSDQVVNEGPPPGAILLSETNP